MRIGFVTDLVFPYMKGGVEHTQRREMTALCKKHEIHSYSMQLDDMKKEFVMDGVRYHAIGKIRSEKRFNRSGTRSIGVALKFAVTLPFILFRRRLDVVQANAFPFLHLPVVKFYCMLTGAKLIIDVAEVWNEKYWIGYKGPVVGRFASAYSHALLRLGDAYIANSGATEKALLDLGVEKGRVFTFSPIIDPDEIKRIKAKSSYEKRVIFVGRLIREKRLDKWVDIVKKASKKARRVNALIIGEGPEKARIKQDIERQGLVGKVSLESSNYPQDKLFSEIRNSAVMLHMSEREGLGAVILQSLALGTPVALPSYSPVPDEVKRMCIVADEEDLPEKISNVIVSRNKRKFLKNTEEMRQFETTNIPNVYARIFKYLGVSRGA